MANDNQTQPGVRISESLWQEFRQDIRNRKGVVRGHLKQELENAIENYLDASRGGDVHDRLTRIESMLEDMQTPPHGSGDESRKKKEDSSVTSRTKKRLDAIEEQIEREAGEASSIHVSVINQAIEDNAGSSRPTIERYQEMLKQRHIAFENPNQDSHTWWTDEETFAKLCHYNWQNHYDTITNEYGSDWYDEVTEMIEDKENNSEKGFQ